MNIELPAGEQVGQLLVLINSDSAPFSIQFPFIHVTTTFACLKDMVWQRCAFMQMHLGNSNHYHWEFVNKDGDFDTVLIMDEKVKQLKDINWSVELDAASTERTTISLLSVLRLVQTPDADLHETQMKINKVIGVNMERQTFDSEAQALSDEVCEHKRSWIQRNENASPIERLLLEYPLRMAESTFKPFNGGERVLLKMRLSETHETTQPVGIHDTAQQLTESLVDILTERYTDAPLDPKQMVLKVVGREQYLPPDAVVCQQKDVKFMLECQRSVSFSVLSLIRIPELAPLPVPRSKLVLVNDVRARQRSVIGPVDGQAGCGSTINFDQLLLNVKLAVNVAEPLDCSELCLVVGLAHGNAFLNDCELIRLSPRPDGRHNGVAADASQCWVPEEEAMALGGIFVSNLPRSARLCLAVVIPAATPACVQHLGWANVPVFDHSDRLNVGEHLLRLWTADDYCGPRRDPLSADADADLLACHLNRERLCRPLGLPGSSADDAAPLVSLRVAAEGLVKDCYTPMTIPHLFYPDLETMMEIAATLPVQHRDLDGHSAARLRQIAGADVLQELAEQDKDFLWQHRFALLEQPACLPRLHACVDWSSSVQVAQYYSLLKGWPHDPDPLNAGMSLQLLHHSFPDKPTREFAVARGLAFLDDRMVAALLPQIIQCLKYEAHIDSALARFLMRRAAVCPEIGNALYYLMRAEMRQSASVAQRFSQLLNVYFLTSVERVDPLYRMSEAMERLSQIQRRLQKHCDYVGKEFQNRLVQWNQCFNNLRNPLFFDTKLYQLRPARCVVFDSKMRPLLLRWTSEDNSSKQLPRHGVIFKSGDDLRQDVLTVQILSMMELIWDRDRLPLRLFPYRVLTLGPREGFIEAIWEAETLSSIRSKTSKYPNCNSTNYLYEWLRHKCDEQRADIGQAVQQFRMTCAAYCVATYVLGIGDRHNDNIMLTQSGNLYHIDFGHFLGNFKRFKHLNIAREFVSFLLVEEFKFVITDGGKDDEALKQFRRLCVDAFMSLRNHANLLLTLFLIMADIGMPELNSPDNLEFLRGRLCLEKSEKEAEYLFQQKMAEDDTFFRKLTVKTTWNFHDMAHKK